MDADTIYLEQRQITLLVNTEVVAEFLVWGFLCVFICFCLGFTMQHVLIGS